MTSTSSWPVIRIPVFAMPTKPPHGLHEDYNATTAHAATHSQYTTLATTLLVLSVVISFASLIILIYYTTKRCRTRASSSSWVLGQPPPAVAITAPTPASNTRGVDPVIIQHLPRFSFKDLKGNTHGLECAVCLIQYEDTDILRFLPSCHHAFHVECIDKWLESRCSCPLCRHIVSSSELDSTILLVDNTLASEEASDPCRSLDLVGAGGASLQVYVSREEAIDAENSPRSQQCLHQEGVILGRNRENSDADASARVLSPRKRLFAHRIVISDVLLQQKGRNEHI